MKNEEPLDTCPRCDRPYSFIRAKVTGNGESWCLDCGEFDGRTRLSTPHEN